MLFVAASGGALAGYEKFKQFSVCLLEHWMTRYTYKQSYTSLKMWQLCAHSTEDLPTFLLP